MEWTAKIACFCVIIHPVARYLVTLMVSLFQCWMLQASLCFRHDAIQFPCLSRQENAEVKVNISRSVLALNTEQV